MANAKRKVKKTVYEGNCYIQATFNNTIITITDLQGMLFLGRAQAGLGSAAPRSLLRMPLRPRARKPPKRRSTMGFRKSTYL